MRFTDPEWLYLLAVPLLLIPFGAFLAYRKRKKLVSLLLGKRPGAENALRLSTQRRFWRIFLLTVAVCLLIAAAAGPYFYSKLLPFEPKGRDLLVVCDVSKSMNSSDIAPSRLKHAKFLLRELASKSKNDRFGLAAFAGNAYLACPLTSDPVTFLEYAEELSTGSVPVGGTNLERALQVAEKAFAGSESSNRAIILLTDGEEVQGDTARAVAGLKKLKIPVFAVGFGDPVNGSVIPLEEGKNALVRDASGKVVTSRLNEKVLTAIARETGGIYLRTTVTDPGVVQLESAISNLGRSGTEKIKKQLPAEEFPKFIGAAAILLVIFLLLSERGGAKKALLLLLLCALTPGAKGSEEPKKEAPALTLPENPAELYNLARKLQLENNPNCREVYEKLLKKVSVDSDEARMSFHNLGAAAHEECRAGLAEAQKDVAAQQLDEALKKLEQTSQKSDSAEEFYSRSVAGTGKLPEPLSANLTRLARDRKAIEELKKKIEELKKQQQKAQNQTQQAQKQNQSKPRNQQQRQQQQSSISKAKQEAEKLRDQAKDMQQEKLANAAEKSAKELEKAAEAKENKEDAKAQKHLENAMKELANQEKKPQSEKDKNEDKGSGKKQSPEKEKEKTAPRPGEKADKKPDSKMSAEQLLDLMGDEDKKLRSEIQKRQNMRRPKVEKDW